MIGGYSKSRFIGKTMEESNKENSLEGRMDKEHEQCLNSSFIDDGAEEVLDDLMNKEAVSSSSIDAYSDITASKTGVPGTGEYDDFEEKFNELFLQTEDLKPQAGFSESRAEDLGTSSEEFSLSFDQNTPESKKQTGSPVPGTRPHMMGDMLGTDLIMMMKLLDKAETSDVLCLIQILIDENKSLQKQMNKMQRTVRLVMSNYRKSVTFLLNELEDSKTLFSELIDSVKVKNEMFCEKIDHIELEMKEVMRLAVELDGHHDHGCIGQLAKLQYENQGLKKLLKIKAESEGNLLYSNKSTQTSIIVEEDKNDGERSADDNDNIQENSNENDDVNSLSSRDSFDSAVEAKTLNSDILAAILDIEEDAISVSVDDNDEGSEMKDDGVI